MSKNNNKSAPGFAYEPLWYKDAIIYELHVRAFFDSAQDGVGDFRGLAGKLDYLQDLGVTAIWLLPFYPSPLRDDGYDIADYHDVHPAYGALKDFKFVLKEAHARGIRVITELVMNHTSDKHPWFQVARNAPPGSPERDFYVWSDTSEKYKEARIIFKDFEWSNWTWDPVASAYYWHRFYSHQPDLNYDNPEVKKAMFNVLRYWFEMGVDGMRIDAVPYLYEREGTNCENLPETHDALRELRRYLDANFKDRMLLAEANQWPEDSVAYFGNGDECHMSFHFPLMPRMFMALRMEDRYPIIDILAQTPKLPDICQWALFLRNHDELTLEMVTDEERDYMYRTYAHDPQMRINLGIRRRLAPLLGNDRRKIELMNGLLFSLPGTPVIYYGDEIGMGDNVYLGDRNGVRTPMQWSPDRNAGFSRANSQRLYLPVVIDPDFHYEHLNVEAQQNNPNSLLWWMKRVITLRKQFKSFGRGTLEFLFPDNRKVLAYVRRFEEEQILVIANLSRLAQYIELDLSKFSGTVPLELFGQTEFPRVGETPYLLTLAPYGFYWFSLQPRTVSDMEAAPRQTPAETPTLEFVGELEELFQGRAKEQFESIIPAYLRTRRWFGGKARRINSTEVLDTVAMPYDKSVARLVLIKVDYTEGDPETYILGLNIAFGDRAQDILHESSQAIVSRLTGGEGGRTRILYEALREKSFAQALLDAIFRRRKLKGEVGEVIATPTEDLRRLRTEANGLEAVVVRTEQSNSSVIYGDRLILKIFRKLGDGINPDLEVGRFFAEKGSFPHTPQLAGSLEYRREEYEPLTLGILQAFVPSEGDAWQYTLDSVGHYLDQVSARSNKSVPVPCMPILQLMKEQVPAPTLELIGPYLESVRLLGQRTAEMHLALAGDKIDPAFSPEPFSGLYQRSIYQSMRNLTANVFQLLRGKLKRISDPVLKREMQWALEKEQSVLQTFRSILDHKLSVSRIRIHGDYHLGQVLFTGKDFVIIDFEGEPARAISERRIKKTPLRDVAGMIRSFHYAAYTSIYGQSPGGKVRPEDIASLEPWSRCWYRWVSAAFLKSYLERAGETQFIPNNPRDLMMLLNIYLLEKAVYEVGYELNNRPEWVRLPLEGMKQILEQETEKAPEESVKTAS